MLVGVSLALGWWPDVSHQIINQISFSRIVCCIRLHLAYHMMLSESMLPILNLPLSF